MALAPNVGLEVLAFEMSTSGVSRLEMSSPLTCKCGCNVVTYSCTGKGHMVLLELWHRAWKNKASVDWSLENMSQSNTVDI